MNHKKLTAYRRIATTTTGVHLTLMLLAGVGGDIVLFLAGLAGAGFAGYARIYFKEALQAMPEINSNYRDLATRLRWELTNEKDFAPDGRLPTHREMAEKFGTTRTTVRRALQVLVDDGQVVIDHGHGTFVVSDTRPANRETGYGTRAILIESHIRSAAAHKATISSVDAMALSFSMSKNTVQRVVNKLIVQGVIKRRRDGTYEAA